MKFDYYPMIEIIWRMIWQWSIVQSRFDTKTTSSTSSRCQKPRLFQVLLGSFRPIHLFTSLGPLKLLHQWMSHHVTCVSCATCTTCTTCNTHSWWLRCVTFLAQSSHQWPLGMLQTSPCISRRPRSCIPTSAVQQGSSIAMATLCGRKNQAKWTWSIRPLRL